MKREWTVPATVERVIDGDTVAVNLDLGWGIYKRDHVRVAAINSPEISTEEGRAARSYAQELLYQGREIRVVSHSLDKYGRALASILYLSNVAPFEDWIDFAGMMISQGHAVPWDGKGAKP